MDDKTWPNVHLLLGFIGTMCAIVSHYYPLPFPDNKPVLIICAVTYFISSWVLQYFQKTWEKDYVLFTKRTATHPKALGVRLTFQLYSDQVVAVCMI